MRPVFAEIRVESLRRNYRLLRENVRRHAGPEADVVAVIKANAYGHGLALCGRALAAEGAPWLGVTCVEEAVALHAAGVPGPRVPGPRVLVMSGFFPGEEGLLLLHGLAAQVWEPWHLGLLDAAARRAGMAAATVPVHLEIDTGMSRQGVAPGPALERLLRSAGLGERDSPLWLEGVLTHFSSPETPENGVMAEQVRRFGAALEQLREAGVRPRWVHAGNSVNAGRGTAVAELSALARRAGAALLVRPGLGLYGCHCDGSQPQDGAGLEPALEPVLCWKTQVTALREVEAGTAVGYNETFHAGRAMRLALLPVGYADGFDRALSGRGSVLVRGMRAPVVGRVSMDQAVVDVSGVPAAAVGNEVVLLGAQGEERIAAEELARWCGTIPYEVLCRIAARVRRVAV